jgi:hypothetical protein
MSKMFHSVRKLISRAFGVRAEAQDVVSEPASESMRRWSQEELAEVRNALGKPLWQVQNEEQEVRRRILTTPYGLQLEEFIDVLLPALCRFPFAPEPSMLNPETVKNLWLASAPFCSETDWETKYAASDAKDALWQLHPVVLESCRVLRRNYEDLRRAKAAGCDEVKVVARKSCGCLRTLDGEYLKVDEALGAFEVSSNGAWVLPLVEGSCANNEDPRICDVSVIAIAPLTTDDDTEFAVLLRDMLREKRQ